ncbi:hypothetical protein, partial [Corynebacterium glyciniphilum]|uniref:hypothetical protein n=1 Tax=Corynebacterium glyciniphilum TaxID=1404244 RepID=UPI001C930E89
MRMRWVWEKGGKEGGRTAVVGMFRRGDRVLRLGGGEVEGGVEGVGEVVEVEGVVEEWDVVVGGDEDVWVVRGEVGG